MNKVSYTEFMPYLFGLVVLLTIAGVVIFIAAQPSAFQRADNRYNECLEIILRKGTLNDAETMCEFYRRK